MKENLVVINTSQLQELISACVKSELSDFFNQTKSKPEKEVKPLVYRTRKYVKDLLHTSYPTLDKYSNPESGILKVHYFGRRKLYLEDELNLAIPIVRNLIKKKKAS